MVIWHISSSFQLTLLTVALMLQCCDVSLSSDSDVCTMAKWCILVVTALLRPL